MADRAVNATPITRLYGFEEGDYDRARRSDSPLDLSRYDSHTLYLVNRSSGQDREIQQYSDLYYGKRKVTDILFANDYPGNEDYPDDKIYFVPLVGDEESIWRLNGQDYTVSPGYNLYFKHNGVVVPIGTSGVRRISYDYEKDEVVMTLGGEGEEGRDVSILTEERLQSFYENLPSSVIDQIINNATNLVIFSKIEDLVSSRIVQPVRDALSAETTIRESQVNSINDSLTLKVYR